VQSLRVGVPLIGAVVLAAAAVLPAISVDTADGGLPAGEHVRARLFLASQWTKDRRCSDDALVVPRFAECVIDDHDDIDGDGLADCWRVHHDELASTLTVWRSCRGEAATFEIGHTGTSLLVIPRELATPTWLFWIARRLAGHDDVACAGFAIAGCDRPGPEWDWILASAERRRAHPGWHGAVAPRWSTGGPVTKPGALIVAHVPAGWMNSHREGVQPDPEGARIIVEAGAPPAAGPITCAGLEIRSGRRGLTANDARGRWTWLFRGLPDRGGFAVTKLACVDDVVLASTGGDFASVAAIDPKTGGWLYAPAFDAGSGASVSALPDGEVQWGDEYGHAIPIPKLHGWLATPFAQRASIEEMAKALRPELVEQVGNIGLLAARDPIGNEELYGDTFDAATLPAGVRASLVARGSCAGWTIASSRTAILAERDTQARWVYVEGASWGRRLTNVRCTGGLIVATRIEPGADLLENEHPAKGDTHILTFDLAHNWWRISR
jgi:hypothetical protein